MAVGTGRNKSDGEQGFSLVEILGVLFLVAVVSAIGAGTFRTTAAVLRGDAGMHMLVWQLKVAREAAINQRREVEVIFTNPNIVTVVRQEIPAGATVISNAVIEQHIEFRQFSGVPDTPSSFGSASPVAFASATRILFTSDGMLIDQAGNVLNGTIFLGQVGNPMSARAVTIFGPTAMIRTYRWSGSAWER